MENFSIIVPFRNGTILVENFEGAFPSGMWQIYDADGTSNGEYYWAKRSYRKHTGSYSAWCVGGGANGSILSDGSNYPSRANSNMVYGPFDLSGCNWAAVTFYAWFYTESNYDYLKFSASVDGSNFYGISISGSSSNSWYSYTFPLTDVPTLGNVTGKSQVWIRFSFTSDGSKQYEGAYLDDIILQKGLVETLSVISSFTTPGSSPWGLTYDGNNLWNSDDNADKVYKLSTTGTVLSSFYTPSSSPGGMAWDGTNLWLADDYSDRIYKLTTSGNTVTSFSTPGYSSSGLAWDGTYLWLCDLAVNTIWKLTTSGQIVSSFSAPGNFHCGLSWNGQSFWLTDGGDGLIYELDAAGNVLNYYLTPIGFPTDLEYDGIDYWLADSYNDRIYKLMGPLIGPNPVASFTVSPDSGLVSTIFTVDASGSRDLQTPTAQLQVRWDWENDGTFDTPWSTTKTATHQYTSAGTYTIKIEVKDADGNTGSKTKNVKVIAPATIPWQDNFPTTTLDPTKWPYNSGPAVISTAGLSEPSAPYSLNLNGTDEVRSQAIDLSGKSNVILKYYYEMGGGGDNAESGNDLFVEYLNSSGNWIKLRQHPGGGSNMSSYVLEEVTLPSGAYYSGFVFRFRTTGDASSDDWFVDDVSIEVKLPPDITVSPNSFAVALNLGDSTTQTLTIRNNGTGELNFKISRSFVIMKQTLPTKPAEQLWGNFVNSNLKSSTIYKKASKVMSETTIGEIALTESEKSILFTNRNYKYTGLEGDIYSSRALKLLDGQSVPIDDSLFVVSSFPAPTSSCRGLTWGNGHLWVSSAAYDDYIFKIDPINGSIISQYIAPGTFPIGLAWDDNSTGGPYLWISDETTDLIYKVRVIDFQTIATFSAPDIYSRDLAWDGVNLWCTGSYNDKIYKLNPINGNILSSFPTPLDWPAGLSWDGDSPGGPYLWHSNSDYIGNNDFIYMINPNNGKVVNTFKSPGTYPTGLAWDRQSIGGPFLWCVDWETDQIYKLKYSGSVLSWFSFSPTSGTISPGGNQNITFKFRSTGLIPDSTYNTNLIITSNDPNKSTVTIPVSLRVGFGPNPIPSFTISPSSGYIGTAFIFDASNCKDGQTPTGQLQVRWDWENDGVYDTPWSTNKVVTHQYFSPGTKTIKLEVKDSDGNTGSMTLNVTVNSRPPQTFDLVKPLSWDTVRTFKPTFIWRAAVDPDPGDTLRYTLYYSTSSGFYSWSTTILDAGTDTSVTVRDSLVEKTRYYWKVEVKDRWGASVMSRQTYYSFLVADLTPPSFTVAILQNPVVTEDIDIYAIPSEALDANGVRAEVNGAPVAMPLHDPNNRIYVGDYQLSTSGIFTVIISGKDAIWGNEGKDTLFVPVQLIKAEKGGMIASLDNRMQLSFPSHAINRDVYIMIIPCEEPKKYDSVLYKKNEEKSDSVLPVGKSYRIEPSSLSLAASVTLLLSYSDKDFEGRAKGKLEIARKEDYKWISIGGEVDNMTNHVTTQINQLGEYRLQLNPNRVESYSKFPTVYALLQNYPNPFNPETTIRYSLPQDFQGLVILTVYNVMGQQVKRLVDKSQVPGNYSVVWNGTDDYGGGVAGGIYLYRLKTAKFIAVNKMLLLK